jgi:hypothetical protein
VYFFEEEKLSLSMQASSNVPAQTQSLTDSLASQTMPNPIKPVFKLKQMTSPTPEFP